MGLGITARTVACFILMLGIAHGRASTPTIDWNFGPGPALGSNPVAGVILANDGKLYGTTKFGGGGRSSLCAVDCGSAFRFDPTTKTVATLHKFSGIDGQGPIGALVQATDGRLYGTTSSNGRGAYPGGTIFSMQLDGGKFRTNYTFHALTTPGDGAAPLSGLIVATDGDLYGMTETGGIPLTGLGTVFRYDLKRGKIIYLHNFQGPDGVGPVGNLLQASDGMLYGATRQGGSAGYGVLFRIKLDGTGFTTLHQFTGPDGSLPSSALIELKNGRLYGTSAGSGGTSAGSLFALNKDGSKFTIVHLFTDSLAGDGPYGGVSLAKDGYFYGVAATGGAAGGWGATYRIRPSGAGFATLHSFAGAPGDAGDSLATLVVGADGLLYGTSIEGGSNQTCNVPAHAYRGCGTLWSFRPGP